MRMISIGSGQWIDLDRIVHVEEQLSGRRPGAGVVLVSIREEDGSERTDGYVGAAAEVISEVWESCDGRPFRQAG